MVASLPLKSKMSRNVRQMRCSSHRKRVKNKLLSFKAKASLSTPHHRLRRSLPSMGILVLYTLVVAPHHAKITMPRAADIKRTTTLQAIPPHRFEFFISQTAALTPYTHCHNTTATKQIFTVKDIFRHPLLSPSVPRTRLPKTFCSNQSLSFYHMSQNFV